MAGTLNPKKANRLRMNLIKHSNSLVSSAFGDSVEVGVVIGCPVGEPVGIEPVGDGPVGEPVGIGPVGDGP